MIETGEVQPGRRCLWRLVAGFSPSCVSPHLKLVIKAQELSRFCSPTAEMVRLFDSNQNLFRPSAHNDMKQIKFVKKKGRSLFNKFITTIRLKASIIPRWLDELITMLFCESCKLIKGEHFPSQLDLPACIHYFLFSSVPFLYINLVLLDAALRKLSESRKNCFNVILKIQVGCGVWSFFLAWILAVVSFRDYWNDGSYAASERLLGYSFLSISLLEYLVLFYYQYKRGFSSTGRLWCFWVVSIFALTPTAAIHIRALIHDLQKNENKPINDFHRIVFLVLWATCFLNWFLQSLPTVKSSFKRKHHPESYSSFLSQLTIWWASPMLFTGFKKSLDLDDMWKCRFEDTADQSSKLLLVNWNAQLRRHGHPEMKFEETKCASAEQTETNNSGKVEWGRDKSTGDDTLNVKFSKEKKKTKPSLLWAMLTTYSGLFVITVLYKLINDILTFTAPKIMELFLEYMNTDHPMWYGVFLAALLLVNSLAQTAFLQRYFYIGTMIGVRQRSALIDLVYRKSLVLSSEGRQASTIGQIVNLMSVDAQKFMDLMTYLNLLWSAPFQIIVAMTLLYQQLGFSSFAGLAYMICTMPINLVIGNQMKKYQVKQMKEKDNRVKLLTDILNGIKVLKLYAWEKAYAAKVTAIRDKEISLIKKAGFLTAFTSFFWICSPYMVALFAFTAYILAGNTLYPTTAFVSMSLFQILRFPMSVLPMLIAQVVQAKVSLERLTKFLLLGELQTNAITRNPSECNAVELKNCTFMWDCEKKTEDCANAADTSTKDEKATEERGEKDQLLGPSDKNPSSSNTRFSLNNIELIIPKRSFAAIVGSVGSGKSSILNAILGELQKIAGDANVDGSVAYVGQQMWIRNATVKENILFGSKFDQRRYERVIDACALTDDLKILDSGDETEIGEKGINLSGGQKARISLARAVYANRDIYLLDDPLAAVDAHVAAHIFEKVIGPCGMLRKKTRLLVTNKLHLLNDAEIIVNLQNGLIKELGTFQELFHKETDDPMSFAQLCKIHMVQEQQDDEKEERKKVCRAKSDESSQSPGLQRKSFTTSTRSIAEVLQECIDEERKKSLQCGSEEEEIEAAEKEDVKKDEGGGKKLMTQEQVETGQVKMKVYIQYCKALGYLLSFFVILGLVVSQLLSYAGMLWIAHWSDKTQKIMGREINSNYTLEDRDEELEQTNTSGLVGYGINGLVFGIVVIVNAATVLIGTMRASSTLHKDMLWGVLRSPLSFFETTPLGRITNRFSKDIDVIDNSLANVMKSFIQCLLIVVTVMIAICKSLPYFFGVVLPLAVIYYLILKYYVATSRQIRRIESKWKSPLYSNFGETLQGLTDIRAYRMSNYFIKKNQELVDILVQTTYANIVMNRWLAVRLECIGTLIVFCTAFILVFHTISAGNAGVAIVYAISCTQVLNWLCRMSSEIETNIVAVERIREYCKLQPEADWESKEGVLADDWPSKGAVEVSDLEVKYREDLKPALKDISCTLNPSEKVGIAGRTGSGKSTMTVSLFRIVEASKGNIKVDSVDISTVGLHDLRSRITIIPQDPVIFVGTIRENLDPFEQYSDQQIWDALELAHLKSFVADLKEQLEFSLGEGGANISVGQRQLICLARAILRKSKILVLDEATASVDLTTDELIQHTIRTEFKDSTVITIAHRINTIMDCDRVLILEQGSVKEFGSPAELIESRGYFFSILERENLLPS